MDDGGPTASIIFFIVLLLIDIFFYGFKAAFESLSESEIERRAEEDRDKKSVRLKKIIDNPAKYKNTVWLITTLSGLVIGALYMELLLRYKPDVITAVLSALLVLYITMTLGVLFPKKLGAKKSEKWAYRKNHCSGNHLLQFLVRLIQKFHYKALFYLCHHQQVVRQRPNLVFQICYE